jgi:AcrR family transcriptional regulator
MTIIDQPTTARSRRTRHALLDAAHAILEEHGFPALTMGDVAQRAGVTRRAAYLHFHSRTDLVAALFDHIAREHDLAGSLKRVWQAPDARGALTCWSEHLARYHPKLIAVDRAITQIERHDPDAAAYRARITKSQRDSCVRLAKWLHRDKQLAHPWTVATAADLLFGLISTDTIDRLLNNCHWKPEQLARRINLLLTRTLALPPNSAADENRPQPRSRVAPPPSRPAQRSSGSQVLHLPP